MRRSGLTSFASLLTTLAIVVLGDCGWGNAGRYLYKGNQLMAQGKAAEASLIYRKAIQVDPSFGEAYYRLGLALIHLGQPADALPAFEIAARLMPARKDIKLAVADLSLADLIAGGNNPGGLHNRITVVTDQLLAEDPRSYDALRLKGHLAINDRNFAEAARYFRMANESKPMQPDVITGWMQALFQGGEPTEAEKLGWLLIGANKRYGPVYDQLYSYYVASNQTADAEKTLATKAENNPSAAEAVLQLARFYADRSKPREMKAALQRLLDRPKIFPQAHLQVGDFYAGRRQWDESISQYEAGAEANPQGRIVYLKRIVDIWLAQEQPARAASVVAEILKLNPSDDSAKAVSASVSLASGKAADLAVAASQFKSLVTKNPENSVWHFAYGRALAAQGDFEGARGQQQEAIKRQPDFLLPQLALAELFQAQGDYRTVLNYANRILAINPDSAPARLLHAIGLMHTGSEREAARELSALERAYPHEPKVQVQLALLDLRQHKFALAENRLRNILAGHVDYVGAYSALVEVLNAQDRLAEAVPLLNRALNQSTEADGVRSLLADTALQLGDANMALAQYRKLIDSQPEQERPYLGLGLAYRQKQDLANAIASFQKAQALAPKDYAPAVLLAQTFVSTGRRPEAILSYRRGLELQPGNAAIMNDLAYQMAETGTDLDQALELAQNAVKKNYRQPQFLDTVGWIYFKKNMLDSAAQIFRNLSDKHPENAVYRYHLGVTLLEKGDKTNAKAELRAALAESPSPELRRAIDAILRTAPAH